MLETGRQLGRRPRDEKRLVRGEQVLALPGGNVGADQVVELGSGHRVSPSSSVASLARPLRVRVLTVPSGMPRYPATSLWESPPQ